MGMIKCSIRTCEIRFDFNDIPAPLTKDQEKNPKCRLHGEWGRPIFCLKSDPLLSFPETLKAYDTLAQHGRWGLGGFWQPFKSAGEKHIAREGFTVQRIA